MIKKNIQLLRVSTPMTREITPTYDSINSFAKTIGKFCYTWYLKLILFHYFSVSFGKFANFVSTTCKNVLLSCILK